MIKLGNEVLNPADIRTTEAKSHHFYKDEPGVVIALGKRGDPTALVDFGYGRPPLTFNRNELRALNSKQAAVLRIAHEWRHTTIEGDLARFGHV